MAISFDTAKLKVVSEGYDNANTSAKSKLNAIEEQLGNVSKPTNWSGPIADTAKVDINNALESLKSISANLEVISSVLTEAYTNFNEIKW